MKKQTKPLTMTVLEMKNAGQKQQQWSDDDREYKFSGPQYVRIVARAVGEDDYSFVRMEVPASIAKQFRIGDKIAVHPSHVTCVTNVTRKEP